MVIDDGPGDDQVEHGYGPATFLNGEGDDRFEGDGDDLFLSGPGADTFRGGRGNDVVSYAAETRPVQIDVTAPGGDGEGDTVHSWIPRIEGGSADDVIVAGMNTTHVSGGPGDDTLSDASRQRYVETTPVTLEGGPGADRLAVVAARRGSPAARATTRSAAGLRRTCCSAVSVRTCSMAAGPTTRSTAARAPTRSPVAPGATRPTTARARHRCA